MTMEQTWHAATWKPGGGARLEAGDGWGGTGGEGARLEPEAGDGWGDTDGSRMEAKWAVPPVRAGWLAVVRPEMLEELEACPFVALVLCPASKSHESKVIWRSAHMLHMAVACAQCAVQAQHARVGGGGLGVARTADGLLRTADALSTERRLSLLLLLGLLVIIALDATLHLE